jgi:hypothetical protein
LRRYAEYWPVRDSLASEYTAVASRDLPASAPSSGTLRRRGEYADSNTTAAGLEEGHGRGDAHASDSEAESAPPEHHTSEQRSSENDSQDLLNFVSLKRMNICYDSCVLLYRHAVPMQLWLYYFSAGPYSFLFYGLYLAIKFTSLVTKTKAALHSAGNFIFEKFVSPHNYMFIFLILFFDASSFIIYIHRNMEVTQHKHNWICCPARHARYATMPCSDPCASPAITSSATTASWSGSSGSPPARYAEKYFRQTLIWGQMIWPQK